MKTPSEWTYHEPRKERRAHVVSRLALTRAKFPADHSTGEITENGPFITVLSVRTRCQSNGLAAASCLRHRMLKQSRLCLFAR